MAGQSNLDTLIATARNALTAIEPQDQTNHTVASAVLADNGNIFVGANVLHFTGGPCAELVALSVAAAGGYSQPGRITHIVALHIDSKRIIPPCGRCRQVLIDLHPQINVILASEQPNTWRVVPVYDLLPNAYRFEA